MTIGNVFLSSYIPSLLFSYLTQSYYFFFFSFLLLSTFSSSLFDCLFQDYLPFFSLQLFFLTGVVLIIGFQKAFQFFIQKEKRKGSICFFIGILLVLFGRTFIGLIIEAFGVLNLFGFDFYPFYPFYPFPFQHYLSQMNFIDISLILQNVTKIHQNNKRILELSF